LILKFFFGKEQENKGMLFFTNLGSTCYFNVAFQLLLGNPEFRTSITNNSSPSGFVQVLQTIIEKYEQSSQSPRGCTIAKRDTMLDIAEFLPILRSHQQQDVIECVDLVLDTLADRSKPRPFPVRNVDSIPRLKEVLQQHYNSLSCLWGIQKRIDTCNKCENVLYEEYSPFSCIQRTREIRTISGATCEFCQCVQDRKSEYSIFEVPNSVIVQIGRHHDDGTKNHRHIPLNENVQILGKTFRLRVVVYHEGYSFSSGHYSCAVFHTQRQQWLYNSDEFSQFFPADFSIRTHKTNCTYAALYSCC